MLSWSLRSGSEFGIRVEDLRRYGSVIIVWTVRNPVVKKRVVRRVPLRKRMNGLRFRCFRSGPVVVVLTTGCVGGAAEVVALRMPFLADWEVRWLRGLKTEWKYSSRCFCDSRVDCICRVQRRGRLC